MKTLKFFGGAFNGKDYSIYLITQRATRKIDKRELKLKFKTYEEADNWMGIMNQRIADHLKKKGEMK